MSTPLPAIDLPTLRAPITKILTGVSIAARLLKASFGPDLTGYVAIAQALENNDEVMSILLDGVNFLRAEGIDSDTIKHLLTKPKSV